jgi:hypothetical protein
MRFFVERFLEKGELWICWTTQRRCPQIHSGENDYDEETRFCYGHKHARHSCFSARETDRYGHYIFEQPKMNEKERVILLG